MPVSRTVLAARLAHVQAAAGRQSEGLKSLLKGSDLSDAGVARSAARMIAAGFERRYKLIDPEFTAALSTVSDPVERRRIHRLLLLESVLQFNRSERFDQLPLLIQHYQLHSLERIVLTETDDQADWLTGSADRYCKDLGLATLALVAVGMRVAEVRSGIHRRALIEGPLRQIPAKLAGILQAGGFRFYIQAHVHDPQIKSLVVSERKEYWRCCALLCKVMPELKGLISIGWIVDPALEWVSPRIYDSGRIPSENGALYFNLGSTAQSIQDALTRSKTRQALYEQGRYRPANWLRIWPRQALIAWADSLGMHDEQIMGE